MIWNVVLWRAFYFCHNSEGVEGYADELWLNLCYFVTCFLLSSQLRSVRELPLKTYDEARIFVVDVDCSITKFETSCGKTSWNLLFLLVWAVRGSWGRLEPTWAWLSTQVGWRPMGPTSFPLWCDTLWLAQNGSLTRLGYWSSNMRGCENRNIPQVEAHALSLSCLAV